MGREGIMEGDYPKRRKRILGDTYFDETALKAAVAEARRWTARLSRKGTEGPGPILL